MAGLALLDRRLQDKRAKMETEIEMEPGADRRPTTISGHAKQRPLDLSSAAALPAQCLSVRVCLVWLWRAPLIRRLIVVLGLVFASG